MNKIKFLESNLQILIGWINSAESRVPYIISISTAMLGVLTYLLQMVESLKIVSTLVIIMTFTILLLSILFSAFAAFPRTKGPKNSIIYFGGISKLSKEDYSRSIDKLNEESYLQDLKDQCHRNAEIANKKYTWIKRSMVLLLTSTIPWLLSIHLLYA